MLITSLIWYYVANRLAVHITASTQRKIGLYYHRKCLIAMIKSILLHPLTALLLTFVAAVSVFSMRQSLQPIKQGEKGLYSLTEEKRILQDSIAQQELDLKLAAEPFYQEKKLRDELLYKLPGEDIIVLGDVPPITLELPSPPPSPTPWQEWRELLF